MKAPRLRLVALPLGFMAVAGLTLAGSGCSECGGTSCGPGGVYVSWLPQEVPVGESYTLCVNETCNAVSPTDSGRSQGTTVLPALEAYGPVDPPDQKTVDVRLEVRQGTSVVDVYEGSGEQQKGCCGYYAGFHVDGPSLRQQE
jgi:hypothetical protein